MSGIHIKPLITPKLVMFDLDGTLAESKRPLTHPMADLLSKLIEKIPVAVVSGGALEQLISQVVDELPADTNLSRLYLLPTSGAALYEWVRDDWKKIYEERIEEKDERRIKKALIAAVEETNLVDLSAPSYGRRIEYRISQVTFSALGQKAPIEQKRIWDPNKTKRRKLVAALQERLPIGFIALMGGMSSVDIVHTGIDKAYGLRKLCARLHIAETETLYIGDQLVKDGNDEAIFKTNAQAHPISSPEDTSRVILSLAT